MLNIVVVLRESNRKTIGIVIVLCIPDQELFYCVQAVKDLSLFVFRNFKRTAAHCGEEPFELVHSSLDKENAFEHVRLLRDNEESVLVGPLRLQLDCVSGPTLNVLIVHSRVQMLV